MADPTAGQRVGFWLLLGVTSTAFAEVLFPTTAFDLATMVLFVVPIYLLYSVTLAAVVYRVDRVSYPTLYLAGILLGLYEAYVTKVVWAPLGDRPTFEVGDIFVFETVGLVLFWHPVVSFVLPVTVVEAVATASTKSLRPPLAGHRFARPLVVAAVGYLLLFQAALGGLLRTLVGNIAALSILLVALLIWRQTGGHTHDMRALLPSGRMLGGFAVVLNVASLLFGLLIRPEKLPTRLIPHVPILVMYLTAGGLLAAVLRGDRPPSTNASVRVTWRRLLGGTGAVIFFSSVLSVVGAPLALPVFLSYYVVAVVVGVVSLGAVAWTVRHDMW